MNDGKLLDQLGPIADEMLGGLQADERMRLAIRRAAMEKPMKRKTNMRLVPALCCAALAICCVGAAGARLGGNTIADAQPQPAAMMARTMPQAAAIDTIAAGEGLVLPEGELVADLGGGARVRMAAPADDSLFAQGEGEFPLVAVGGAVYRMLKTPEDVGEGMLAGEIGSVAAYDEQPSLASPAEMQAGLSNAAQAGAKVYALSGLAHSTAVAAEVDGSMRVFQRMSYAGKGPAGDTLEETFSVRGQVKTAALSGVGELHGEAANAAIAVLLDHAALKATDMQAGGDTLTVTLESGLKLQLGVSGDTLCGCGGWSCPEFFEAFEAAL